MLRAHLPTAPRGGYVLAIMISCLAAAVSVAPAPSAVPARSAGLSAAPSPHAADTLPSLRILAEAVDPAVLAAAPAPGPGAHSPAATATTATTATTPTTARASRASHRLGRRAASAAAPRPAWVRPSWGELTSTFGWRWGRLHAGIDLAGPTGTPILAAADGVIIEAGPADGFGLMMKIRHDDGSETVYGHMDTIVVHGGRVHAGQLIATVGSRGHSTGPHLHFEVRLNGVAIDPIPWLRSHGVTV